MTPCDNLAIPLEGAVYRRLATAGLIVEPSRQRDRNDRQQLGYDERLAGRDAEQSAEEAARWDQPLPMCETTPVAFLVAMELFLIWVGDELVCIGVAVPFADVLAHPVSYCEGAPAPWRALP